VGVVLNLVSAHRRKDRSPIPLPEPLRARDARSGCESP
jgi:hypothetical protein